MRIWPERANCVANRKTIGPPQCALNGLDLILTMTHDDLAYSIPVASRVRGPSTECRDTNGDIIRANETCIINSFQEPYRRLSKLGRV